MIKRERDYIMKTTLFYGVMLVFIFHWMNGTEQMYSIKMTDILL